MNDLNLKPAASAPASTSGVSKSINEGSVSSHKSPLKLPEVGNSPKKMRRPFSAEEERKIIEGFRRFGSNWKAITLHYKLEDRSPVDIKDKVRNLIKAGKIQ